MNKWTFNLSTLEVRNETEGREFRLPSWRFAEMLKEKIRLKQRLAFLEVRKGVVSHGQLRNR